MPHELVNTGAPVTGNESIYETIGLESWTSTHNAPILFTQALNDPTGGGNQADWLEDYHLAIEAIDANADSTLETINGPANEDAAHAAFTSDATLQGHIRSHVGGSNTSDSITNQQFTIVPADCQTYTVDNTS